MFDELVREIGSGHALHGRIGSTRGVRRVGPMAGTLAHTSEANPETDATCNFFVRHLLPSYFDAPLSNSR